MKSLIKIIIFCLSISTAIASKLEDVTILEIKQADDKFELKLHSKNGPKDSFFFVAIDKKDEKAFEKMALTLKKLKMKDNFKLGLDIPSFSMVPSGSFYRSNDITFLGTASNESIMLP